MYSISDYGQMIADRLRMDAHVEALRRVIRPDSVVVDIGTGAGIFALIAARLGAQRVYAIEPSDAIQLARDFARINGFAHSIQFIQDRSVDVDLPEKAHVIVSDLRGVLPLFADHLASVIDARTRFLTPGGALVPQCDTVWVALVSADKLYQACVAPWQTKRFGLDLAAGQRMVLNRYRKAQIAARQLCEQPRCWAELDYRRITGPDVAASLRWTIQQDRAVHGFTVWFDSCLAEAVGFSNAPGKPELIYGHTFFPWLEPVALKQDDTVDLLLEARLVGGEYVWRWDTHVRDVHSRLRAEFKQSTFFGTPLSPARLHKQAEDFTAALNADGRVVKHALSLMAGDTPLIQIGQALRQRFPERFADHAQALDYVRQLADKYGA
ncbi:MAG: 50S ribosomal protein L11 methyltransferase [Gammaproteobacteria bacterium]|nr:50S ribosomal protein L11 methyltransferase [Gammaproteobacteria bacterium]